MRKAITEITVTIPERDHMPTFNIAAENILMAVAACSMKKGTYRYGLYMCLVLRMAGKIMGACVKTIVATNPRKTECRIVSSDDERLHKTMDIASHA